MMILPPEAQEQYEEQIRASTVVQLTIAKILQRAAGMRDTTFPFPVYLEQSFALTSDPQLYKALHELMTMKDSAQ